MWPSSAWRGGAEAGSSCGRTSLAWMPNSPSRSRSSVLNEISGGATLGRSREADIILDDANVSRKHAEVRPSGGSWIVRDLGSTNGIKVNGRRVDPSRPQSIKPGDVIELGTSRAIFELE